jgi:hypothetical protein
MPRKSYLGEFEHMVLLAILQGGEDASSAPLHGYARRNRPAAEVP